jgi:carboxyl-terminal processing protease
MVAGMSLDEVVSRVRGEKGTTVKIAVYRKQETAPREFVIKRDEITVPSVESEIKTATGGKVGYIALHQFGDHSMDEVREALAEFSGQNLKGIIIDLRFNGGGYLDGAVELTSMFLNEGLVVQVEKRGGETEQLKVLGNAAFASVPLAIMINEGSASASEIVAGALQDQGRAKIIGMTSFGKGTVQDVIDLPGGSSLRVTVAHWLTPKGKNLAKEGIEPDIRIDRSAEDFQTERDPQLDAALVWITEGRDVAMNSSDR